MTIGSIVSIVIGVAVLVGGLIWGICLVQDDYERGAGIAVIIISLIIAALCIAIPPIYMKTEAGARALKDQQSNFNQGMERTVEVYDVNGKMIKKYEGRFDIETDNVNGCPYIVFDDEKDKRHIIYYTTGTIIIDEQ